MKVRLYLQGISEDLKPTGSYEVLDLGVVNLNNVIDLLKQLPRGYPDEVMSMDDYCPMHIIMEHDEVLMSVALLSDGKYYVMMSDKMSGWDFEMVMDTLDDVVNAIRRYVGGEDVEAPALENPTYSIPVKIGGSVMYIVLNLSQGTLDHIPLNNIVRVEIKRGSMFSKPRIEIVYFDETGNIDSVKYELAERKDVEKHYNALAMVLGSRAILK